MQKVLRAALGPESAPGGEGLVLMCPGRVERNTQLTSGPLFSPRSPVRPRRSLSRAVVHWSGDISSARPLFPSTRHTGVSAVSMSAMAGGVLHTYLPGPRLVPGPQSVR